MLTMAGCAVGPSPSSMVATIRTETNVTADGVLVVSKVIGGEETNPIIMSKIDNDSFREALYKSLKYLGLFEKTILQGKGDYRLNAEILSQELKGGINMAATLLVRYELYLESSNQTVWAENIFSQHEAYFEESYDGNKRAQLANEGVAKNNISQLIVKLRAYIKSSN